MRNNDAQPPPKAVKPHSLGGALHGHFKSSWSDFTIQQGLQTLPRTKGLGLEEEASAI